MVIKKLPFGFKNLLSSSRRYSSDHVSGGFLTNARTFAVQGTQVIE